MYNIAPAPTKERDLVRPPGPPTPSSPPPVRDDPSSFLSLSRLCVHGSRRGPHAVAKFSQVANGDSRTARRALIGANPHVGVFLLLGPIGCAPGSGRTTPGPAPRASSSSSARSSVPPRAWSDRGGGAPSGCASGGRPSARDGATRTTRPHRRRTIRAPAPDPKIRVPATTGSRSGS